MGRRRWYPVAAALVAAMLAGTPGAAAAAAPGISVSLDGSSFSTSPAQPVFAVQPTLVPLDSAEAGFWVRNDGAEPARLTLMLDGATWNDAAFAAALTVATDVDGVSGTALPLSTSSACPVLASGVVLDPGEAVEVTAVLTLGDLTAQEGQGASVGMDVSIGLSSAAGPATAPCTGGTVEPGTVVTVVPRGGPAAATAVVDDAPDTTDAGEGEAAPLDPFEQLAALLPNTLGSFDAWLVLLATASIPVGALAFLLIGRRRRGGDEDEVAP